MNKNAHSRVFYISGNDETITRKIVRLTKDYKEANESSINRLHPIAPSSVSNDS